MICEQFADGLSESAPANRSAGAAVTAASAAAETTPASNSGTPVSSPRPSPVPGVRRDNLTKTSSTTVLPTAPRASPRPTATAGSVSATPTSPRAVPASAASAAAAASATAAQPVSPRPPGRGGVELSCMPLVLIARAVPVTPPPKPSPIAVPRSPPATRRAAQGTNTSTGGPGGSSGDDVGGSRSSLPRFSSHRHMAKSPAPSGSVSPNSAPGNNGKG